MHATEINLIAFLRHPVENTPADLRPVQLLRTFGWFCLLQCTGMIGTVLFALLWEIDLPLREALRDNTLRGILLAVLFAPLLEEAMFRLPLKRNDTTLLVALAITVFWVVSALCVGRGIRSAERLPLRLVLTLCALPPLWYVVRRIAARIRFPRYFYLLAALFAGAHLYNIEFGSLHLSFPVVTFLTWYLAEKFLTGSLYGYARLKHGFAAACFLHALNNAIPFVLLMIFNRIFGT